MAARKNSTKDLPKNVSDLIKEALKRRKKVAYTQLSHIEDMSKNDYPDPKLTGTTIIINIGTGAKLEAIKWLCEN